MNSAEKFDILGCVTALCHENSARLLYLSKFGSELYGTAIPGKSDTDIKGVFLPDKKKILLGRGKRHLTFKTGTDNGKNSAKDVDIELWSLDYWLLELLRKGETGAIDLLFSTTNPACVIFKDPFMDRIFSEPLRFVDAKRQTNYISYAINQARKYGIKGSRMGIIKNVCEWLDKHTWDEDDRLNRFIDELAEKFGDGQYCGIVERNNEKSLCLCGKIHMGSTRLDEFARRIRLHYDTYGARAKAAMEGNGIDWKALSHAMRAIFQMEELCEAGKITYPLKSAPELMAIKTGKYPWETVEQMILDGIERTKGKLAEAVFPDYAPEQADRIVLEAYSENT